MASCSVITIVCGLSTTLSPVFLYREPTFRSTLGQAITASHTNRFVRTSWRSLAIHVNASRRSWESSSSPWGGAESFGPSLIASGSAALPLLNGDDQQLRRDPEEPDQAERETHALRAFLGPVAQIHGEEQ